MKRLAVVRIRGPAGVNTKTNDTMGMLRLNRVNHCVVIDDRATYKGMLRRCQGYLTWGEMDEADVENLLKNRGEIESGLPLTDDYIKENTKYKGIADFAKAFMKFEAELSDIPKLKPVFRLHPPRKGHGGIKRNVKAGGALGERSSLKDLLIKMR